MKPQLDGIMETVLYVDDLKRAREFYMEVFDLKLMTKDARFVALRVAGKHDLLLFKRGVSLSPTHLPGGGVIPPHNGSGQLHIAFAISAESLPDWEKHLADHGVAVESRLDWPTGGTSLYFRDPDGNLLELLTPAVWQNY